MADRKDAELIVQLLQWGTAMGLEEAYQAVLGEGFDPDAVPDNDPLVNRILLFGETLGTFTKNGLLDTELVHDLWWVGGMWGRVGPSALRARAKFGEPRLYENFEGLAQRG